MRKFSGLISVLLLICMLMLVSGCANGEIPDESSLAEDTAEPVTGDREYVIVRDGVSQVAVVRPDDADTDDDIVVCAVDINNLIKGYTSKNKSDIYTDWNRADDDGSCEILVGDVNYSQRRQVSPDVGLGMYAIKAVGDKIVVYARTSAAMNAMEKALGEIFEKCKTVNEDGTVNIIVPSSELDVEGVADKLLGDIPVADGMTASKATSISAGSKSVVFSKATWEMYDSFTSVLLAAGYSCGGVYKTDTDAVSVYSNGEKRLEIQFQKGSKSITMGVNKSTDTSCTMYVMCVADSAPVKTEASETAAQSTLISAMKKYDVLNISESADNGWIKVTDGTNTGYCRSSDVKAFLNLSSLKAYAAVVWARDIAADNDFHYGYSSWAHHYGCYFCGTNSKNGTKCSYGAAYEDQLKTYCCNPFVTASYCHGAGAVKVGWDVSKTVNCVGKNINLANDSNKPLTESGKFVFIAKPDNVNELQAGDILLTPTHAMLYAGNGNILEASGSDDNVVNSSTWNNSIRERAIPASSWEKVTKIYRYIGE